LPKRKRKTLFGQSYYNRRELQATNLKGLVYKFSILIPVKEGDEWDIFSHKEIDQLTKLLDGDFGGSTNTPALEVTQHPLLIGRYKMGNKMITNTHVRFELYAQQNNVVIEYFQELKENLENYSKEIIAKRLQSNGYTTYTGEEQILIEYSLATIL